MQQVPSVENVFDQVFFFSMTEYCINISCLGSLELSFVIHILLVHPTRCFYFNRTITRLLEGILFICGLSSIICARAEQGCK